MRHALLATNVQPPWGQMYNSDRRRGFPNFKCNQSGSHVKNVGQGAEGSTFKKGGSHKMEFARRNRLHISLKTFIIKRSISDLN